MTRYIGMVCSILLVGCNTDGGSEPDITQPTQVSITTEFHQGASGWSEGFSDYPVADADTFEFVSGINPVPGNTNNIGFLVGGVNRSDDLFMFLKKQVHGLAPNTRYLLTAEARIWSDAGSFCIGIGGAPGESVFIKVGASELEPEQADYHMNIDIGSQSQEGSDAKVIGNIANEGATCEGGTFASKQVALTAEMDFEIISSVQGDIWLLIGSDSGYEGRTHLYYESVSFALTPVQ